MSTKTSGIYMIRNKKDNKVYIGQSKQIETRWGQHRGHLLEGTHTATELQYEFIKNKGKNLEFKVIEECSEEVLLEREKYYIDKYNAIENGYNNGRYGIKCPEGEFVCEKLLEILNKSSNKNLHINLWSFPVWEYIGVSREVLFFANVSKHPDILHEKNLYFDILDKEWLILCHLDIDKKQLNNIHEVYYEEELLC